MSISFPHSLSFFEVGVFVGQLGRIHLACKGCRRGQGRRGYCNDSDGH